jgi:hypothetical protein
MPDFLQPGNLLLGQYLIQQVMPYSYIEENKLTKQDSVFPKRVNTQGGAAGGFNNSGSQLSVQTSSADERIKGGPSTHSVPPEDIEAENKDKVDDFLFTSPFTLTSFYRRKKQSEQPQQRYLTLYCMDYMFRIKTKALFD